MAGHWERPDYERWHIGSDGDELMRGDRFKLMDDLDGQQVPTMDRIVFWIGVWIGLTALAFAVFLAAAVYVKYWGGD